VETDDAQALVDWLDANDYSVPEKSLAPIQAYVNAGHVFLALKLASDRTTGDITPIVVRFEEQGPCIPLLLTSIAATPDMPIYAWVLAEQGIVSIDDFYEIEVNEAAIGWLAFGANYRAVATHAVDQAGGRGFIREYSGSSSLLARAVYDEARYDLDARWPHPARRSAGCSRDSARRPRGDRQAVPPMPAEAQAQASRPYTASASVLRRPTGPRRRGLVAALDAVVQPLGRQSLSIGTYLTRLFTTISPDEMTLDPLFRQNAHAPEVAVNRVVTAQRRCDPFVNPDRTTAPIRLHLPSGDQMTIDAEDPFHPSAPFFVDEDGDFIDDRTASAPHRCRRSPERSATEPTANPATPSSTTATESTSSCTATAAAASCPAAPPAQGRGW
jgi:hypothetical protein